MPTKIDATQKYIVMLGRGGNSYSTINKGNSGSNMARHGGPVLDCSAYLAFWMTWEDAKIEVGPGEVLGSNPFLSWQDLENPLEVNFIGLSSWGDEWTFRFIGFQ